MARLDALELTASLKKRLVDYAVADNALRDPNVMELCRSIWSASGKDGGLASDLWVEGSIPHLSSDKTLQDAVEEKLFSKKLCQHLYTRSVFSNEMKLYHHQWQALKTAQEHPSCATIVSAGTGAGKTETFLLPLLNDLFSRPRQSDGGCRAIILYPMNALVNDQVDRLYYWLQGQKTLTLCHFTSETPENRSYVKGLPKFDPCRYRTRQQARGWEDADGRTLGTAERPRGSVPDILITNYSMLEYMLCRPQDSVFFGADLRAIILDEAHLYTSTLAAEVTLLLRRLYDKCGVRPSEVSQYATSATIVTGKKEEQIVQLKEFASVLFSRTPDDVYPILGLQAESAMPSPEPPELAPTARSILSHNTGVATVELDKKGHDVLVQDRSQCEKFAPLLEQLVAADRVQKALNACNDIPAHLLLSLQYSPHFQKLEALLRKKKQQRLADLSIGLWNDSSPESQQATAALLNLGAAARVSLNHAPLLPHRLHQMFRPPSGFSVCCNPECGESDFPGLGKIYPERLEKCSECGSVCLALYRCPSCSEHYLAGEEAKGRIGVVTRRATVFYTLSELGGQKIQLNLKRCREDTRGQLTLNRCTERCLRCGEGSKEFRPLETSAPIVLSILAETMLAGMPPLSTKREGDNQYLPAEGRRLLAFSDSRSDAASLGPRLRHQHEIQLIRSAIVKMVLESPGPDQEILDYFRQEIEELEKKLKGNYFPKPLEQGKRQELQLLKDQREAVLKGDGIESWANKLVKREEIAQLFDEDGGDDQYAESWTQRTWESNMRKIRERGARLLGRELFRLPKRSYVNVETIGYLEVVYPGIEDLQVPRALLAQISTAASRRRLEDIWYDLLASLLDTVRYAGGATFGDPREDSLWYSEGRIPGQWMGKRQFVGATERQRRRTFLQRVLCKIGVDEYDVMAEKVLTEVFDLLKAKAVSVSIDGVTENHREGQFSWLQTSIRQQEHGNESALRLVFPNLILRRPPKLFRSNITEHVWPRSVCGCAPEPSEDGTLEPVTPEELDEAPFIGRIRRELKANIPTFQMGLWAEEHSAQLSPHEARRRQELFKIGGRNILSATTTLELGIDIGGLSGAFLANAPPGLANYLQRAGRVGRRSDGSSIVVTCARSRPYDREVFRDIGRFLSSPLRRPLVLMERHRIVARHFHAWLMGKFFSQIYGPEQWVGAMNAFGRMGVFCGQPLPTWNAEDEPTKKETPYPDGGVLPDWWKTHDEGGLAENFIDWVSAVGQNLSRWAPILDGVFKDTPLTDESASWTQILEQAKDIFRNGIGRWLKNYTSLLATWNESTSKSQKNAIRYQLKLLYRTTVIEAMASARFLPRYGFPIGVHTLKVVTTKKGDDSRQEDQFRLSRPGILALREYVPGSQLLVGGKLVTSRGILKHWTGANLDDAMGLRGGSAICAKNHLFYWIGEKTDCPQCGGRGANPQNLLFPAHGFTTAAWDPPRRSADVERVGTVSTGTIAFANLKSTALIDEALAGVVGLKAVYQEEAEMLVYNRGEHGRGFAICTRCGYADSELKDDTGKLPPSFSRHKPLLIEKGGPCWHDLDSQPVLREQSLAANEPTDMLLLDFSKVLDSGAEKENLVTSLAIAFRLAGARLLELDSRELGEIVLQDQEVWSAVLYDNVPGGAGHVLELMKRGKEWLKATRQLLYGTKEHHENCRTACLDCLMTFDAQNYFIGTDTALDRRAALEWIEQMIEMSS